MKPKREERNKKNMYFLVHVERHLEHVNCSSEFLPVITSTAATQLISKPSVGKEDGRADQVEATKKAHTRNFFR